MKYYKMFVGLRSIHSFNPQQLAQLLEPFQLIFLYLHFQSEQIWELHEQ